MKELPSILKYSKIKIINVFLVIYIFAYIYIYIIYREINIHQQIYQRVLKTT